MKRSETPESRYTLAAIRLERKLNSFVAECATDLALDKPTCYPL